MKKEDNKNIFCSVSAGYSSVMMAIKLREWYPDHNIINVMANTSKERIESLEFMNECDKHYNLNLIWIEAEFNELGVGVSPRVVSYENLKRNGEVYESGIQKLGIPSKINKWCNRDMKLEPMRKYVDSIFGKNNYSIAVGIRADEMDRVRNDYFTNNVFYPLLDRGLGKKDRNKFWDSQPIKIKIPAFKGNCDLCFEKSNRKLMTILKEEPQLGQWWESMIDKYGKMEKKNSPAYNDIMNENGQMTFYREYKTIFDLVKMAQRPFSKATDEYIYENDLFDFEGDCGSGCQVF
jgi:hypothetical protein